MAVLVGCSREEMATSETDDSSPTDGATTQASSESDTPAGLADVLSVSVQGSTWSIEIRSPDTGCDQYASWWEVVRPDQTLVYRRILTHSHVDEQPFVRSGGPVEVSADDEVIVRAYMYPQGYGGQAMRGTASSGFSVDTTLTDDFAPDLAELAPQPEGCAF